MTVAEHLLSKVLADCYTDIVGDVLIVDGNVELSAAEQLWLHAFFAAVKESSDPA